jgi:predicted  nucleic acid-binding Zn-ribbon protein
VRLGEVVFCPSCGRLLYLPEGWDNAARKRD